MTKVSKVIVGLLLLTGLAVQAQESFFTANDVEDLYLVGKKTTYFNNGPVIKTWVKVQNRYENRYSMDLIEVHCPTGMYRMTARATYVNGGHYRDGYQDPGAAWIEAIPTTIGAAFSRLCR